MKDSWEADDFEPELPAETRSLLETTPASWEDEEEDNDAGVAKIGLAPQLSERTQKRMQAQAAHDKETKLDALLQENESEEDRRLRERRVVEEGDNELTNELFGAVESIPGVTPDSIVIKLKDLKEHLALVITLNEKMASSKKNHVVAFVKEFIRSNEEKFDITDLSELITMLSNQREAKQKAQKKPTVSKKDQSKSKKHSKKEQLEAKKRHEDNFGVATARDKYDNYDDQFDDFF
mmetsp:Transcript_29783/g.91189  ORF Transcript_29783/g.91189 Transcript_29783/m.91189 type:complete len:236 (-) Transcript_29783:441-1148(-)